MADAVLSKVSQAISEIYSKLTVSHRDAGLLLNDLESSSSPPKSVQLTNASSSHGAAAKYLYDNRLFIPSDAYHRGNYEPHTVPLAYWI